MFVRESVVVGDKTLTLETGRLAKQAHGSCLISCGGSVVLVAPNIENGKDALIQTPGGELILAAGQKVTIGSLDPNGVQFEVQG